MIATRQYQRLFRLVSANNIKQHVLWLLLLLIALVGIAKWYLNNNHYNKIFFFSSDPHLLTLCPVVPSFLGADVQSQWPLCVLGQLLRNNCDIWQGRKLSENTSLSIDVQFELKFSNAGKVKKIRNNSSGKLGKLCMSEMVKKFQKGQIQNKFQDWTAPIFSLQA